jgi:hypothetical protein
VVRGPGRPVKLSCTFCEHLSRVYLGARALPRYVNKVSSYDKGRQAIRTAQARARRTADDIARLAAMTPEEIASALEEQDLEKKRKREEQLEKGRLRMKKTRAGTPKD